ncbi:trans-aconitate 2-methyltransferase [Comamonas sp. NLF-1-9]|uniref:trans-aconitate 2-methyltransferase n=1 Tax=Comamonas sp. NLF-1-9 TaxID=2853163 RepID=UPI001C464CCC|nr:trans-aconitate 2-methyltransferase [Comamonas sp. NLF-1-9]QXL85038.1 trans-aconitate 2-methyltransferase [Comamonas sp. NLF-1-9]
MPDWNPALYLHFAPQRTRPAAELLARVPLVSVREVVDLGCGPGTSTALLAQRYAGARVLGLDSSAAMIERARALVPQAVFRHQDLRAWLEAMEQGAGSEPAPELIFANATLQWVPEHEGLLPRLFARLAPGGVLAVQMPDNLHEPAHRLMQELAQQPRFAPHLAAAGALRTPLLAPDAYYDLLAAPSAQAVEVDIWRSTYLHAMESPDAIVHWFLATGLKPYVEALPAALQGDFVDAYRARIADAYPARVDGCRLLAFPRLFILARRRP